MNISGVLLAGGKSTRFGFSKLEIKIGPLPLLADQVLKLSFFCPQIIISTSEGTHSHVCGHLNKIDYFFKLMETGWLSLYHPVSAMPDIRVVKDKDVFPARDRGPIMGIYSALKEINGDYALVLAADMPLVSYRLLDMLIKAGKKEVRDAYIIKTQKGYEVLCGLYSKSCLGVLEENITVGKNKVSDCFSKLDVKIIDERVLGRLEIDMLNFLNINNRQDFQRFKGIWGKEELEGGNISSFIKRWAYFYFR